MFSHNLYEALCQSQPDNNDARSAQNDDPSVMEAIERAMQTYQRLFTSQDSAE
ncbi:MAG: hypothetical protein U0931_36705 [Vulcanimicrobiota bacterium]